jgi:hypothetical protein
MNAPIRLTPELEQQILASIRSGGYPHVAAAAWGVPGPLWEKWQRRGRKRRAFKEFFRKVSAAQGQARLKAEMNAFDEDVRFWLKHGPGKEQPGNPGWSALTRPVEQRRRTADDIFACPTLLQLLNRLRAVVADNPTALAEVTDIEAEARGHGIV